MKKSEAAIIASVIIRLVADESLPNVAGRGGRGRKSEARRILRQKLIRVLTTAKQDPDEDEEILSTKEKVIVDDWRVW